MPLRRLTPFSIPSAHSQRNYFRIIALRDFARVGPRLASLCATPYTEIAAIHQRAWEGMTRRRGHVRNGNPA